MFIIWGTRVSRKRLGYVAGYCVRCRDVRRFRFFEHRSVGHLYFVPLGRSRRVACSIRCATCRTESFVEPDDFAEVARDRKLPLEALCDQTNPGLVEQTAARLDAMDRVTAGTATPEERMALVMEAVGWGVVPVEQRAAQTHFDLWTVLAFFAIFPAVGLVVAPVAAIGNEVAFITACVASLVVFIGLFIWVMLTEVGRFYRRRIERVLVELLAPVGPTRDELEAARAFLQAHGCRLHKYLDPIRLLNRLTRQADAAVLVAP